MGSLFRYAYSTAILADISNDLQLLLNDVNEACKEIGLKMHINKTKFMVVSRNCFSNIHIHISGETIEQVNKSKYLGCLINNKWDSETEIKCRIEQARVTFQKLKNEMILRANLEDRKLVDLIEKRKIFYLGHSLLQKI